MSIQKYKINFWKQLQYTWFVLSIFLGAIILTIYASQEYPDNSFLEAAIVIYSVLLFLLVPFLILHIKYYLLNKNLIILYIPEAREITIKNRKLETETVFTLDDIKYVFHTKSGSGLMPWSSYYFTEIYLKDGKKFIVTCLLASNFKLPVGDKYESTIVNYPYPKGF